MEYPFKQINGFLSAHIRSMGTESGCHMGGQWIFLLQENQNRESNVQCFIYLILKVEKWESSSFFVSFFFFKQFEFSISTRYFLLISADWSAAVLQGRSPPLLQVILDVYSKYSSYFSHQITRQINSSIQSVFLCLLWYKFWFASSGHVLYDGCHHSIPWSPSNFVCLNN